MRNTCGIVDIFNLRHASGAMAAVVNPDIIYHWKHIT